MNESSARSWTAIWSSRAPKPTSTSSLRDLVRADGFDTPFSFPDPDAWTRHVRQWSDELSLVPGSSVYEVGCGAGAFLLPLEERGMRVGGCDLSPGLVDLARRALKSSDLEVCEGALAPVTPRYTAVIAHGVFQYFPDLSYAQRVLVRMVAKASRTVAILDLPDAERQEEETATRVRAFGGEDAYRERYEGLEMLSFEKEWMSEVLRELGMRCVTFSDFTVPGRPVLSTRFDVVAIR